MNSSHNIEDTVIKDVNFPPVYERYFSHFYFMPKNANKKTMIKSLYDLQKPLPLPCKDPSFEGQEDLVSSLSNSYYQPNGQDTLIMMHSNRICVVCISEKHPIIVGKKKVMEVNYDVGGINRLSNKVSGKGKRGAQVLGLFSPLCKITCKDNSSYTLFAGVRGKLIEVNERLLDQPNLISEAPKSNGYLAIILPKLNESNNLKQLLLSPSDYQKIYERE